MGAFFIWYADMYKGPKSAQDIVTARSCSALLRNYRTELQDASGLRGASSLVAAGEEAALPAVPYQLGYATKDVEVDFQVRCTPQRAKSFSQALPPEASQRQGSLV